LRFYIAWLQLSQKIFLAPYFAVICEDEREEKHILYERDMQIFLVKDGISNRGNKSEFFHLIVLARIITRFKKLYRKA
jgi:hypothetical protein